MFVIMRHGERGDQVHPPQESSIDFDVPLSKEAHTDILKSAKQISSLILSHGIKVVQIHSSPFLRCLMTAQLLHNYITSILSDKAEVRESIQVNNMFCEFLRPEWFSSLPLGHLNLDSEEIVKYTQPSRFAPDPSQNNMDFPENYIKFSQRCARAKEQFTRSLAGNECRIIVTHGFVVREICVDRRKYLRFGEEIPFCDFQATLDSRILKRLNSPLEASRL